MIEVISGTDRPGSNSIKVATQVVETFQKMGAPVSLINLQQMVLGDIHGGNYFQGAQGTFQPYVQRIVRADGLVIVTPEYNGSFPGILKLFIDYWPYPQAFENRPVAFIGLGNRWGGLRPVEHLQQVFGYRNAFVYPVRVFLPNIKMLMAKGRIEDPELVSLMNAQAEGFIKFIAGLKHQGLDANSRMKASGVLP